MGRDGLRVSFRNITLKHSDIHLWLSALCEDPAPARSTVFNSARNFSADKEPAQLDVRE